MKGSKRLDQIKEDNKKQLKNYLSMTKIMLYHLVNKIVKKFKINLVYMLFLIKNTNICRSNWRIFNRLSTYY